MLNGKCFIYCGKAQSNKNTSQHDKKISLLAGNNLFGYLQTPAAKSGQLVANLVLLPFSKGRTGNKIKWWYSRSVRHTQDRGIGVQHANHSSTLPRLPAPQTVLIGRIVY